MMSYQQDRSRPIPLNLDVHSEVPEGQSTQSTQSTTLSKAQRELARNIKLFPRADLTGVSSSEPSPDSVPDLETDVSTSSSTTDLVSGHIPQNSFAADAARRERRRDDLQAREVQRGSVEHTEEVGHSARKRSFVQSTPNQFHSSYEADADRDRILREGRRLDQGVRSALSSQPHQSDSTQTCLSPPSSSKPLAGRFALEDEQEGRESRNESFGAVIGAVHIPQPHIGTHSYLPSSPMLHGRVGSEAERHPWPELPPRPVRAVRGYLARGMQLVANFVARRGHMARHEGTEMDTFSRAAESHAGLDPEREQQRQDDGLTEERSHRLGVVGWTVVAVAGTAMISGLVIKFGNAN